jgi:FkbM family methyltransferase
MIDAIETRYGTMFIPDTDNGQYDWLKNIGASPEDDTIQLICGLLDERPKGIAIDCGANFGCWTLPLARHAKRVVAFEPQRCVHELLMRTIAANPDLNIEALQLALGIRPGIIAVPDVSLENTTNFGGISLGIPHPEHPNAPMSAVEVVRLDDVVGMLGRISFIKADVEGAEFGLLQGARRVIEEWRPIIVAEADHPLTDTQALGNLIESFGYNVDIVEHNNFIGMPL